MFYAAAVADDLAKFGAVPGNLAFVVRLLVLCLTIVLVAVGTWQTEAPFGDHRNSLLPPAQMLRL